jgi:diketogulonate reductase-like aldo/keto reductase
MKRRPREVLVILTKTSSRMANDLIKDPDRFRQEIGTDYIDIVLLHAQGVTCHSRLVDVLKRLPDASPRG